MNYIKNNHMPYISSRYSPAERSYLTATLPIDLDAHRAACNSVNEARGEIRRLNAQDNSRGRLDAEILAAEDNLTSLEHDRNLWAQVIHIKIHLYSSDQGGVDCDFEAWTWVNSDIGRWQDGGLEDMQRHVNNYINTNHADELTAYYEGIIGTRPETPISDSSNENPRESDYEDQSDEGSSVSGNGSSESDSEGRYEPTPSEIDSILASPGLGPLSRDLDWNYSESETSESNLDQGGEDNQSKSEPGKVDIPNDKDSSIQDISYPNTSGLGLKTGEVHKALPPYHSPSSAVYTDNTNSSDPGNSDVGSIDKNSTVDFIVDKQATEMPDIMDLDGGD